MSTPCGSEAEHTPDGEVAHRMWALENVKRNDRGQCCTTHGNSYDANCVVCAYHLGRIVGHIEAGAYWTHAEAMARITESIQR
jgi:hypothetical protein